MRNKLLIKLLVLYVVVILAVPAVGLLTSSRVEKSIDEALLKKYHAEAEELEVIYRTVHDETDKNEFLEEFNLEVPLDISLTPAYESDILIIQGTVLEDRFEDTLLITLTASLIFSVLLGILIYKIIVSPMRKLIHATEQYAGGDYSSRVDIKSKDELGELAGSLNNMAESLEKIENMRRELVSNVSHELATPLTNIKGYLEAVKDGVINGEEPTKETLDILTEETERLTAMVEDLRKLSSYESSCFELEPVDVDLVDLVEKVLFTLKPKYDAKKIEILTDIPSDLPSLTADENSLRQILVNLIDNAINFTQDYGKIVVSARESGSAMLISVSDNGIGISEDDLKHIFERFYRADKSRSRDYGGTGIGLAIVQELVKVHQGSIKVESKLGEGSKFTISLPYQN